MGLIVVSGLTHVGMGFTAGRGVILSQVLGGFWVMALFALYTSVPGCHLNLLTIRALEKVVRCNRMYLVGVSAFLSGLALVRAVSPGSSLEL